MRSEICGYSVQETFKTGDRPNQYWGVCGGREDFEYDGAWSGCIDAVEYIPTGAVKLIVSEECIVARSIARQ